MQSIVPCCCPACVATITGNVQGCASLNLPGATVTAHDSTAGGTVLGTATTNASGNFSVVATGAIPGNNIVVVVSKARFVSQTFTLTWVASSPTGGQWSCGATTSGLGGGITLVPAAGYTCLNSVCPDPLANTIFAHFSGPAGVQTMTLAGGVWGATFVQGGTTYTVSFGSNPGGAFNSTVTGGGCGNTPTFVSCPPSFLQTIGLNNAPCTTDLGSSVSITE